MIDLTKLTALDLNAALANNGYEIDDAGWIKDLRFKKITKDKVFVYNVLCVDDQISLADEIREQYYITELFVSVDFETGLLEAEYSGVVKYVRDFL